VSVKRGVPVDPRVGGLAANELEMLADKSLELADRYARAAPFMEDEEGRQIALALSNWRRSLGLYFRELSADAERKEAEQPDERGPLRWFRRAARPGRRSRRKPERPMSEMTPPTALSQPARALQLANRVRRERSKLKTRIADGELSVAELILTCPPEIASMPIAQLLASQRGWGEVKSRTLLAQAAVREDKSVGTITERQRRTIASLLRSEVARA
jgi:hypothetical protein